MSGELIFEKRASGQNNYKLPEWNGPSSTIIPASSIRTEIKLPDCSEPAVVRHYNNLSRMNFGVDNGMYPLGSCTMKYNPKINERIAGKKNFSMVHPLSDEENSQGALRILYELSEYLSLITGWGDLHFRLLPVLTANLRELWL
jgi:glycine dehydrogenase subunit 2